MRTCIAVAMLLVCSVGWAQDQSRVAQNPPIEVAPGVSPSLDEPLGVRQGGRLTLQADACVISLPQATEPPPTQGAGDGWVWIGSPRLAAHVPANGVWTGMGPAHNYRDKWWWWREGYRASKETQPELTTLATRLDASLRQLSWKAQRMRYWQVSI